MLLTARCASFPTSYELGHARTVLINTPTVHPHANTETNKTNRRERRDSYWRVLKQASFGGRVSFDVNYLNPPPVIVFLPFRRRASFANPARKSRSSKLSQFSARHDCRAFTGAPRVGVGWRRLGKSQARTLAQKPTHLPGPSEAHQVGKRPAGRTQNRGRPPQAGF